MRELISRLEKLQAEWYAGKIDGETFAYQVFSITTELRSYIVADEHLQACPMVTFG